MNPRLRATQKECKNCETVRRAIKARGYCTRCYPIVLRLDAIKHWDLQRPDTLKYYPPSSAFRTNRYFAALQMGFTAQLSTQLMVLRARESQRRHGVDGMAIEMQLRRLARRAGAGRDVHYHSAGYIADVFPQDQRRILFQLLDDIEERIPRHILSIGRALDQYESHIKET